jgi:hypothetical protein
MIAESAMDLEVRCESKFIRIRIINKISGVFFILTFLGILSPNVFSQGVCPITTLKVNKVNGKIVSKFNKDDVLPDLKVELRKTND